MLSFCTTVCRPLPAQIDDHSAICISIFLIFHLPRDHMYRGLKKIIISTLIPWLAGKSLAWDDTIVNTVAESYISISASLGGTAEHATARKSAKYLSLPGFHIYHVMSCTTNHHCNVSLVLLSERKGVPYGTLPNGISVHSLHCTSLSSPDYICNIQSADTWVMSSFAKTFVLDLNCIIFMRNNCKKHPFY